MEALESNQQDLAEALYEQVSVLTHQAAVFYFTGCGCRREIGRMARRTPWQPEEGTGHCTVQPPSVAAGLCFSSVQDVRLHMAAGGNFEHVALTLYQCGTLQVGAGLTIDCITQSVERHTTGLASSRASSAVCGRVLPRLPAMRSTTNPVMSLAAEP